MEVVEQQSCPVLCCPVSSCPPVSISVSSKVSVLAGGGINRFQRHLTNDLSTRFVYRAAQTSLCPNGNRHRQMALVWPFGCQVRVWSGPREGCSVQPASLRGTNVPAHLLLRAGSSGRSYPSSGAGQAGVLRMMYGRQPSVPRLLGLQHVELQNRHSRRHEPEPAHLRSKTRRRRPSNADSPLQLTRKPACLRNPRRNGALARLLLKLDHLGRVALGAVQAIEARLLVSIPS